MIFLQSGVEKLPTRQGIEPTTLGLGSQSGAFNLSAPAIPGFTSQPTTKAFELQSHN